MEATLAPIGGGSDESFLTESLKSEEPTVGHIGNDTQSAVMRDGGTGSHERPSGDHQADAKGPLVPAVHDKEILLSAAQYICKLEPTLVKILDRLEYMESCFMQYDEQYENGHKKLPKANLGFMDHGSVGKTPENDPPVVGTS